ncbi:hypothetical protein [Ekhidna sp.]|jgi:uncharacterized membrane protein YcaP (DUF421 family)|uniref:hypothetical protein n=1 Tax=Ekhidna sp. TaxID=2608089 RepID=UPI0032EC6ECF
MEYGNFSISDSVLIAFIVCMTFLAACFIHALAPVRKTNASTRFWTSILPSIGTIVSALVGKKEKVKWWEYLICFVVLVVFSIAVFNGVG